MKTYYTLPIAGWSETGSLPELGVNSIRIKLDTGANTSALHAFNIVEVVREGMPWVDFEIHPLQRNDTYIIKCSAPVADRRYVTSSNGHKEKRFVIFSRFRLGEIEWPIEITLANRDEMNFRMLLGRSAMENRLLVDPHRTHLLSRPLRQKRKKK